MRFRSLVVWCVCAILCGVQITSGNRSRSTYHPFSDIETLLERSPRNIPNLTSSVLSLPVSQLRSPSSSTEDAVLKSGEIERIRHQILLKLKQVAENIIKSSAIHHKRKKKCRCRKYCNRRNTKLSLLKSKAPRELKGLSTVKNLFISSGNKSDRNDSASTLNHMLESTMETSTTSQHFMDIAFTTPNVVPLINAMTIAEAARNVTRETNRNSHKRYKIKCIMKKCRRRRKKKMNIIDVLDQAFFQDNLRNMKAPRMEATSSSLENVDHRPIVD